VHRPPKYLELTTIWNKRDLADPHLRSASHKADPIGCSPSTMTENFLSVTHKYQPRRDKLDSPNASLVHFYLQKLVISFITRGDIMWQESSQCVTESRLPVQACCLSIVRDTHCHFRHALCPWRETCSVLWPAGAGIQVHNNPEPSSSQFYNQPAEIPLLTCLYLWAIPT
jgi:hypothetical protein